MSQDDATVAVQNFVELSKRLDDLVQGRAKNPKAEAKVLLEWLEGDSENEPGLESLRPYMLDYFDRIIAEPVPVRSTIPLPGIRTSRVTTAAAPTETKAVPPQPVIVVGGITPTGQLLPPTAVTVRAPLVRTAAVETKAVPTQPVIVASGISSTGRILPPSSPRSTVRPPVTTAALQPPLVADSKALPSGTAVVPTSGSATQDIHSTLDQSDRRLALLDQIDRRLIAIHGRVDELIAEDENPSTSLARRNEIKNELNNLRREAGQLAGNVYNEYVPRVVAPRSPTRVVPPPVSPTRAALTSRPVSPRATALPVVQPVRVTPPTVVRAPASPTRTVARPVSPVRTPVVLQPPLVADSTALPSGRTVVPTGTVVPATTSTVVARSAGIGLPVPTKRILPIRVARPQ